MTKDLFSLQASDYAKYRPHYPPALFDFLATLTPRRDLAWDCGTGNGQAAVALAKYFRRIIATDPSEKQLSNAVANSRVEYRKGSAEKTSIESRTVDLVTVAQAFHWFQFDAFFAEVRRVCRPQGSAIAIWTYAICQITPEIDSIVNHYYHDIVGAYWEPERRYVEEGYVNQPFPFIPVATPAMHLEAQWPFDHFHGYLRSWSATQTAAKRLGADPLEHTTEPLRKAWGLAERTVSWPLALRVGRL